MTDLQLPVEQLQAFAVEVLRAAGADDVSASGAARALAHASLLGVDSHGFRLLPIYVESLRTGLVNGRPNIARHYPRPAAVVIDADGGMGHAPTYMAAEAACGIAGEQGIGLGLVLRSSHFGAAGAYALAMAEAGFVGMAMCNSGALVAPFGGSKPVHGTDPIAFAAPAVASDGSMADPFLLDMATSSIPWNRVLLSRSLKKPLPVDVAMEQGGAFTTDAEAVAMLAPLGGREFGYKGAGLAGMIEILCASLTGMRFGFEQDRAALVDTVVGHLVIAIDPGMQADPHSGARRVAAYMDILTGQSSDNQPVFPAGGPQWINRAQRLKGGVPVPASVEAELRALAHSMSIGWPPT